MEAVMKAHDIIERNEDLLKYSNVQLYQHQKELFSIVNNNKDPVLLLYQAPTGTGKTMNCIKYITCVTSLLGLAAVLVAYSPTEADSKSKSNPRV